MSPAYLLRRLLAVVLVLWIVTIAVFVITMILPGNAAVMILGEYATPDLIAALEDRLGLNRPVAVQYIDWLFNLLQGDLGCPAAVAPRIRGGWFCVCQLGSSGRHRFDNGNGGRRAARHDRRAETRHEGRFGHQLHGVCRLGDAGIRHGKHCCW